jgi:hypothetical protein
METRTIGFMQLLLSSFGGAAHGAGLSWRCAGPLKTKLREIGGMMECPAGVKISS